MSFCITQVSCFDQKERKRPISCLEKRPFSKTVYTDKYPRQGQAIWKEGGRIRKGCYSARKVGLLTNCRMYKGAICDSRHDACLEPGEAEGMDENFGSIDNFRLVHPYLIHQSVSKKITQLNQFCFQYL